MQLQIPERQSERLVVLSTRTGRSAEELVTEAVDRLLAEDQWFDVQAQVGIEQIARGEFLNEEAMDARVARMLHR